MALVQADLETLLKDAFPTAEIHITDLAGDGDHYQASIVSPDFAGKTRIQQHQLVYSALNGKMGCELHALALKTRAP
jgi:stress-induced morphogen